MKKKCGKSRSLGECVLDVCKSMESRRSYTFIVEKTYETLWYRSQRYYAALLCGALNVRRTSELESIHAYVYANTQNSLRTDKLWPNLCPPIPMKIEFLQDFIENRSALKHLYSTIPYIARQAAN